MSNEEDLKTRFEGMITFITDSCAQIRADQMVQLGNLDTDVNALCNDVKDLPAEVGQAVRPLMETMIARLDELAQALNEYQDRHTGAS